MKTMKQHCLLINVWFTWLGIPAIAVLMGFFFDWWAVPFIIVVGIFAQVIYIKIFPKISRYLGYGSVEDISDEHPHQPVAFSKVTLYTANVCPFCPIIRQRPKELQRIYSFELSEIDISFQPALIQQKGIKSVPVVEIDGRLWIGNATTAQLISFLTNAR